MNRWITPVSLLVAYIEGEGRLVDDLRAERRAAAAREAEQVQVDRATHGRPSPD